MALSSLMPSVVSAWNEAERFADAAAEASERYADAAVIAMLRF